MDEFNKFSIEELNLTDLVLDEFLKYNSPDPSLQNLQNLIKEEIERRTAIIEENSLESFKKKYTGQYISYHSDDRIIHFKIDEIVYNSGMCMVFVNTTFLITEWLDAKYEEVTKTEIPRTMFSINPYHLSLGRGVTLSSEEEFKEKLNKIINNGLKKSN